MAMRDTHAPAGTGSRILALAARFLREEGGDDLIEYALLTTCVGAVGAAAMTFFSSQIAAAYQSWNYGQQNLWRPDPPTQ
jgi:Flp pilus assembly pilin Flp